MKPCLVLLLGTIAAAVAQQEKNVDILQTLQKNDFTLFIDLLRIAGIRKPNPDAVFTIMAPTNQAVKTWLDKMGLTMEEMKGRPGLAAAVVAYHVIPRVKGNKQTILNMKPVPSKSNPLLAITADNVYGLRLYTGPGGTVVIEDTQGNTAKVVKPNIDAGTSIIHGIDKVMLSGDVYLNLLDFLKSHPEFEVMKKLVDESGLVGQLNLNTTVLTVFAPTDAAFTAVKDRLSKATPAQVKEILLYHMLPGEYSIPADFKDDQGYDTLLKGHKVKLDVQEVKNKTQIAGLNLFVVPETSTLAAKHNPRVVLANMYAHKITIHGIDRVMFPAQKTAANTQAAAPAPKPSGRRHLQQDRRAIGMMTVNSVSMTNTQSAIRQAVEGRSSAVDATASGTFQAQAASVRCWNCVSQTERGWGN